MAGEVRVTQVTALVELAPQPAAYVTQVGALVELTTAQVRVTQFGVLVELEALPSFGGGAGAGQGRARQPLSARAQAAGNALFNALAAAKGAVGRGTVLATGAPAAQATGAVMGASETRLIAPEVIVWWDGITPTDETAYFVSASGGAALTPPERMIAGGQGQVDSCTIVLGNHTRRFSRRNTTGALYDHISAGVYLRPVTVSVTVNGVKHRLFTGVLRDMSESLSTTKQAGTVSLDCRSRDELLLQDRRSTPLADYLAGSGAAHTEDHHIEALLALAGLADGTDYVSQAWAEAHPGTPPTIDPGIFPIRYVWADDESVLEEIWALTAASGGWFYADHLGVLHYHNICAVLPAQLAKQYGALTTLELDETQVAGLELDWPAEELYGEVTVEVSPRSPGQVEEIWTPEDVVIVQPGETKTVWARLDSALVAEPVLSWAAYTAGGLALAAGVTVTPTYYAQRVKLVIANTGTAAAHLNTLALTGQTIQGGRAVEVTEASDLPFWISRATVRKRTLRSNFYVQHETQARTLATYLLARQERETLTVDVPGVDRPDVRLAHPVSIEYMTGVPAAGAITGLVQAVDWTLDRGGYRVDMTILETGSLFGGVTAWFVLGSATTGKLGASGAAGEGYLFY